MPNILHFLNCQQVGFLSSMSSDLSLFDHPKNQPFPNFIIFAPALSMMQPVMGITTLMISQIPEQTDAESFRRLMFSDVFCLSHVFCFVIPKFR